MFKRRVLAAISVAVFVIATASGSQFGSDEDLNYRLPNDSLPLSYDLWLSTDIHKSSFSFDGRVKIHIKVLAPTRTLTLHSRDIAVDSVNLLDPKTGAVRSARLPFDHHDTLDFILVQLPALHNAGDEIALDFSFRGQLADDPRGFFKTYYITAAFDEEWMALTHFEPISARRAFVCYDEPQIKTPFRLRLRHDKSYHAISNVPINKTVPVAGGDYVTSEFLETPPLSTYELGFVVSRLAHVSNSRADFEQRVYGEPEKVRNGTAQFALGVATEVVDKFFEIFQMPLSIPKLDHAAIPLINGATEHLGVITYEDNFLLIDESFEQTVLDYFKPLIIQIIAHETSHQFFGDLVTHAWWSHLWLSEGFATFYQYHLPQLLYPHYEFMERFRDEVLDYAFMLDRNNEMAMGDYVQTPFEIENKFNPIAFEKAAAVIRMFFEALTPEVFTRGIVGYLENGKFGAVTPDDLYAALQRAYDESQVERKINQLDKKCVQLDLTIQLDSKICQVSPDTIPLDIGSAMSSWELQPGYPVVNVRKAGKSIIVTQEKFNDPQASAIFTIPLTITTQSSSPQHTTVWMTKKSMEIANILTSDDDWLVMNVQQVGYYRVDYSRDVWRSIIRGYGGVPRINRELLHEEMHIAWQTLGTMKACDCMRLMSVLGRETVGSVWERAEYIDSLNEMLLFGDFYAKFREKLSDIVEPHMHILGESTVDEKLLNQVTKWSKVAQHEPFLMHELNKLLAFMQTNGSSSKPDFCSAFRIANASIYNFYANEMLHFESFIDMDLVFGLGCSLDAALLRDLFARVIDSENGVSFWLVMEVFQSSIESSEIGLETVMGFVGANFTQLEQYSDSMVETLVTVTHQYINSDRHLKQFKDLTKILTENRVITADLRNTLIGNIEERLAAREWKELEVCFSADGEQTSSAYETTETPSEQTTETTTLGAVTQSTSIKIIAICISLCVFMSG